MGKLIIPPQVYSENYNLDISKYVDRHTFREKAQKSGNQILYMSYPHALNLFKTRHPNLSVVMERNPQTNGFVFPEEDSRGYFLVGHCEDDEDNIGESYYFAVLNASGGAILPSDKNHADKPLASSQEYNKAFYRAVTKVIALTTGIGLKLWTGEDLSSEILTNKQILQRRYNELVDQWLHLTGEQLDYASYTDLDADITRKGKDLKVRIEQHMNQKEDIGELVPEATSETKATKKKPQ